MCRSALQSAEAPNGGGHMFDGKFAAEWDAWCGGLFTDLCILCGTDYLPSLKGVGVSLVRSGVRELAYFCLSEILLETTISSLHTRADLLVTELRLDNQMPEAQLPVVLIRSAALRPRISERADREGALPRCVHVSVVKRAVTGRERHRAQRRCSSVRSARLSRAPRRWAPGSPLAAARSTI